MNDTSDLIPENETNWQNDWQIPYYDNLTEEQQKEITDSIRLLLRQTFVLERKYDKKTERLQYTAAYRIISKHFPFIRHYLAVAGDRADRKQPFRDHLCTGRRSAGRKASKTGHPLSSGIKADL